MSLAVKSLYLVAIFLVIIGFVTVSHFRGLHEAMADLGSFLMLSGLGVFVAVFLKTKR